MIIVEGPDGAGKTTLIKQLQERYNLPVAPRVVNKDTEAMVDLKTWVEDNVTEGFQDMIFDRHRLISEPIYGPIIRGAVEPGFEDLTWMLVQMSRFYACKPVIIYCLPPLEVIKENLEHDIDNQVVWGSIDLIYAAYVARAAIDNMGNYSTVTLWDYTRDGNPEVEGPDFLRHFDHIIKRRLIGKNN